MLEAVLLSLCAPWRCFSACVLLGGWRRVVDAILFTLGIVSREGVGLHCLHRSKQRGRANPHANSAQGPPYCTGCWFNRPQGTSTFCSRACARRGEVAEPPWAACGQCGVERHLVDAPLCTAFCRFAAARPPGGANTPPNATAPPSPDRGQIVTPDTPPAQRPGPETRNADWPAQVRAEEHSRRAEPSAASSSGGPPPVGQESDE